MTQKEKILKALKAGRRLTPLDALSEFGCFRLGARIYELKRELSGTCYQIITETKKSDNGKKFAEYRLGRARK